MYVNQWHSNSNWSWHYYNYYTLHHNIDPPRCLTTRMHWTKKWQNAVHYWLSIMSSFVMWHINFLSQFSLLSLMYSVKISNTNSLLKTTGYTTEYLVKLFHETSAKMYYVATYSSYRKQRALTAISRQADIEIPDPSICLRAYSLVSCPPGLSQGNRRQGLFYFTTLFG